MRSYDNVRSPFGGHGVAPCRGARNARPRGPCGRRPWRRGSWCRGGTDGGAWRRWRRSARTSSPPRSTPRPTAWRCSTSRDGACTWTRPAARCSARRLRSWCAPADRWPVPDDDSAGRPCPRRLLRGLRPAPRGGPAQRCRAELVRGERTVQTHLGIVLTKLDLESRTQAALWAVREGLVHPW